MVEDDGDGMPAGLRETGHGLANMRTRAERHGGTLSVVSATPVTDVLEVGGNVQLGGTAKIEVTGPAGQVVRVYAALDDAFLTVKSMGLFLDTASLSFLLQGSIPATGKLQVTLNVPNDPVLADLDVFFQVVRLQAGGGFTLGNSDCKTIQP